VSDEKLEIGKDARKNALRKACQQYIDFIEDKPAFSEDDHNDFKQEVFEKGMEYILGILIWDRVKKALEGKIESKEEDD
jgi:hypothetical protein